MIVSIYVQDKSRNIFLTGSAPLHALHVGELSWEADGVYAATFWRIAYAAQNVVTLARETGEDWIAQSVAPWHTRY
jgi:hypothetical protein